MTAVTAAASFVLSAYEYKPCVLSVLRMRSARMMRSQVSSL
eukprot:CAMPEP_0173308398 /NCGR_PEP_ID=MMETSP1143-20121109/21725_1 /TAXON_ID=483371 /ORGANISM="non described non described, Strain CCMP2298" /LENGTH=40 /DNA_ID= /DNA_START= /DNA_END= /DNA_ORIENTATION=